MERCSCLNDYNPAVFVSSGDGADDDMEFTVRNESKGKIRTFIKRNLTTGQETKFRTLFGHHEDSCFDRDRNKEIQEFLSKERSKSVTTVQSQPPILQPDLLEPPSTTENTALIQQPKKQQKRSKTPATQKKKPAPSAPAKKQSKQLLKKAEAEALPPPPVVIE